MREDFGLWMVMLMVCVVIWLTITGVVGHKNMQACVDSGQPYLRCVEILK